MLLPNELFGLNIEMYDGNGIFLASQDYISFANEINFLQMDIKK